MILLYSVLRAPLRKTSYTSRIWWSDFKFKVANLLETSKSQYHGGCVSIGPTIARCYLELPISKNRPNRKSFLMALIM